MKIIKKLLLRIGRLIKQIIGHDVRYPIQVICPKIHLGTEYGGYCVCPRNITKESIIYSFGVGEDISWDLAMIEKFGVNIYAFDPTPKSINWVKSQKLPKEFHFFEFGISDYDGIAKFYPPENPKHVSYRMLYRPGTAHKITYAKVHRLKTILNMLGHQKIDVLKLDIEGTEYAAIEDFIDSDIEVYQLLVEFHHRFEGIEGISKTKKAIESLNKKGFKIFDISPNGEVYSFIHF